MKLVKLKNEIAIYCGESQAETFVLPKIVEKLSKYSDGDYNITITKGIDAYFAITKGYYWIFEYPPEEEDDHLKVTGSCQQIVTNTFKEMFNKLDDFQFSINVSNLDTSNEE